ncbi:MULTISPECIES: hypothetical protein [unclassified Pseudomonas]|uniref:hypothetical protein n=1 Tax=unclassified Pseudomonas TaxID=196821 RepID=UPI000BA32901|nr:MULTISPECIES: hypothetical protein [unclassified Pseudomonas]POA20342.1 hypothetical protein C1886_08970 [Pseudomonas sp. FW300-N1A1]
MYENPANAGFFYDVLQGIPHAMAVITARDLLDHDLKGGGGKQLLDVNQARYAAEPFNRW